MDFRKKLALGVIVMIVILVALFFLLDKLIGV